MLNSGKPGVGTNQDTVHCIDGAFLASDPGTQCVHRPQQFLLVQLLPRAMSLTMQVQIEQRSHGHARCLPRQARQLQHVTKAQPLQGIHQVGEFTGMFGERRHHTQHCV
ncbi:hypothetical protein D3C75_404930 [compost metagenome]